MNTIDASSTGFDDSLINPEQRMDERAIAEVSLSHEEATVISILYRC